MTAFPLILAALLVLASGPDPRASDHGLPDALKIPVEEAEERFFDGDYDEALRKLRAAKEWLDKDSNVKALGAQGEDHGLFRAILAGLEAQILAAKGELDRSRSAIESARKWLLARRNFLARRKIVNPDLWKYEAFLLFVEGDLHRSLPIFDLASDESVPDGLRKLLTSRANAAKSVRLYKRADEILARPPANKLNDLVYRRLRGRLLVGLAHGAIYKSGYPTDADVSDANDYLERAEELFRGNPSWNAFIAPDADVPTSYKNLRDERTLDSSKTIELKRSFYGAIQDWLSVKLTRVELSAAVESSSGPTQPDIMPAEKGYSLVLGFCRAHFPHDHPRCRTIMMSRARWYTYLAHSMPPGDGDLHRHAKVSLLKDSMFEAAKVRLCTNVGQPLLDECDVIELNALRQILRLDGGTDGGSATSRRSDDDARIAVLQDRLAEQDRKRRDHEGEP